MSDTAPPGLDDFLSSDQPDEDTAAPAATMAPAGLDEFVADEVNEEKYGSGLSQLGTAAESAASALTFGLSKGAENFVGEKLGIPELQREAIEGRESENPWSSGAGAVGGVVGGLMTGGATAAVPKAIEGAAKLGSAALKLGKVATTAARGAIEGLLYAAGNENAKLMMGDPNQSIGSAVTNIGLSGLLSGGIAGSIGGAQQLWTSKFGSKVANELDNAIGSITDGKPLPGEVPSVPTGPSSAKELIEQELLRQKPNAYEVTKAAERLGVTPTTGMTTASRLGQDIEGGLAKRPTIAGARVAKEYDETLKTLARNADETLAGRGDYTPAEAGREVKQGILDPLKKELAVIEGQYDKLKPHLEKMAISQPAREAAKQRIRASMGALAELPDTVEAKAAEKIINNLDSLKTVNGIKEYRTSISRELDGLMKGGDGSQKIPVLQAARDALTDMRTASVTEAAERAGAPNSLAREAIEEIIATDKAYRGYKVKLKSLGDEASLGNIGNARKLLERLEKIPDEKFASRIFDVKDSGQLQFFNDKFPRAFETAKKYKLQEIYENSLEQGMGKNGEFSIQKYLSQLREDGSKKIGPEALNFILDPASQQKLADIRTVYRSMPGNPNPSGTSFAMAMGKMFTPEGLVNNANDMAQYFLLKAMPHLQKAAASVGGDEAAELAAVKFAAEAEKGASPEGFKAMAGFFRNMINGEKRINKSVDSLFSPAAPMVLPQKKDTKKLKNTLAKMNPAELLETDHGIGHYLPHHEMATAETAGSAVAYLHSLNQATYKALPFDTKPAVSNIMQDKLERALEIAEDPLSVIADVKNGSVAPEDLVHLKSMYPGLYSRLAEKMMTQLATLGPDAEVPYRTRIGMSLFLASPLDSTMTPMAIQAIQASVIPTAPMEEMNPNMDKLSKLPGAYQTPGQSRQAARSSRA